jgi:predicted nucleic acid-binding protein
MRAVIDCSATIPLLLDDEDSRYTERVFESLDGEEALAPAIWWYEVRNVLTVAERRKRLNEARTTELLRQLERLPVRVEWTAPAAEVVSLARRHRLTVYDAAYIELARRERCVLASADRELRKAAATMGLDLFG